MASTVDPDGRKRTFAYDAAGRIVAEDWYDAAGVLVDRLRFAYDAAGRLAAASNNAGAYTFLYDASGRLVYETEPDNQWLSFRYSGDAVTRLDSAGGRQVSIYDSQDRLVSRRTIAPGQPTLEAFFAYDAAGRLASITRTTNGASSGRTVYSYDASGAVETILDYDAAGDLVDSQAYAYDDQGRLASELDGVDVGDEGGVSGGDEGMVDDPGATSYTYDDAGRLTSDGTTTYTYDAAGNRTGGGYVVGTGNQLLSDGTWNYSYDAAGDRVGKVDPATGVSWTYAYDAADRLVSAVEKNASGAVVAGETYVYDVFGDRIQETTWQSGDPSPTVVRQAYDGPNAWADFNANNQLATRYVFGDGTDQILARESSATGVAWYLTDRLGSVRDVVGASGSVLDHLDYDPSGNVTVETNPSYGDRYKFTAREYDALTGLYYNRARWYDPTTGVWITPDPSNVAAGDPNVYRYAAGDPVDYTDPSGLASGLGTDDDWGDEIIGADDDWGGGDWGDPPNPYANQPGMRAETRWWITQKTDEFLAFMFRRADEVWREPIIAGLTQGDLPKGSYVGGIAGDFSPLTDPVQEGIENLKRRLPTRVGVLAELTLQLMLPGSRGAASIESTGERTGAALSAEEARLGAGAAGESYWVTAKGIIVRDAEGNIIHEIPFISGGAPEAIAREFEIGSRISVPGLGDPLRGTSLKVGRQRLEALGFEELPQTASSGRITFQKVIQVEGGKRTVQIHFDPNDAGGPNWHKYIVDKHGQPYELNDRGYVEAYGTNNPINRVHIPGRRS